MPEYYVICQDMPGQLATVIDARTTVTPAVDELKQQPPYDGSDPARPQWIAAIDLETYKVLQDRTKIERPQRGGYCWQCNAGEPMGSNIGSWADPADSKTAWQSGSEVPDARPTITFEYEGRTIGELEKMQHDRDADQPEDTIAITIKAPGLSGTMYWDIADTPMALHFTDGRAVLPWGTNIAQRTFIDTTSEYVMSQPALITVRAARKGL